MPSFRWSCKKLSGAVKGAALDVAPTLGVMAKTFDDDDAYGEVLFTLTNTNGHSAGKHRPEANEQGDFRASAL